MNVCVVDFQTCVVLFGGEGRLLGTYMKHLYLSSTT